MPNPCYRSERGHIVLLLYAVLHGSNLADGGPTIVRPFNHSIKKRGNQASLAFEPSKNSCNRIREAQMLPV
jgi:hypothetical protein